jgi:hypothetical protein
MSKNTEPMYHTEAGTSWGKNIPQHTEKIKLRLWTFGFWQQRTVLDLFSGMGFLSERYIQAGCKNLYCIEKEQEYFDEMKKRLDKYPNCAIYHGDNIKWSEANLGNIRDITFVDFDAFGCPNKQIQLFFKLYPIKEQAVIINVTDGGFYNLRRFSNIDVQETYLTKVSKEYDIKRRLSRLMPELQQQFIRTLAMQYDFNIHFLYHAMNDEANVCYYGFIAYPQTEVKIFGFGQSQTIRFKKDETSMIKTLKKLVKTQNFF